jgi:hypothetical protein
MAKKSRYYPVVRKAPISSGASANTLVDSARFLSVANRRLYRFGRNYSMKVDIRPDYAGPAIEVYVLRDDWAVQKAFQMAYQHYLDNTSEEREVLSPNQIARWEDFRVRDGINVAGGTNQARPVLFKENGSFVVLTGGEFIDSTVVDSSNTTRAFTWSSTPNSSEYSLLNEYDKAGNAQGAPSSISTSGPYEELNSEINATTMDDLQNDGNLPPYTQTGVNENSPWVRIAVLGSGAAGQQKLSSGFFTAPCGLIFLKGFTEAGDAYSVEIEAKSGDYKGVHAPSMIEVATVNRKRKVVK